MGTIENIRSGVDIIRLGSVSTKIGKAVTSDAADGQAIKIAKKVEDQKIDPLQAESLLNDLQRPRTDNQRAEQACQSELEKGGQILERLVDGNHLDPLFAEEALNSSLLPRVVMHTLDRIERK